MEAVKKFFCLVCITAFGTHMTDLFINARLVADPRPTQHVRLCCSCTKERLRSCSSKPSLFSPSRSLTRPRLPQRLPTPSMARRSSLRSLPGSSPTSLPVPTTPHPPTTVTPDSPFSSPMPSTAPNYTPPSPLLPSSSSTVSRRAFPLPAAHPATASSFLPT
jgi:hypothetical protein